MQLSKPILIRAKVWQYPGMAGWYFVTLPKGKSKTINSQFSEAKRGWGSLPVIASIGNTTWKTSLFPDTKIGSYLLPLKAAIRKKENIIEGRTVSFSIEIVL